MITVHLGVKQKLKKNVNAQRMTEMTSPFECSPKGIRNSKRNSYLKDDDAPKYVGVTNESEMWIILKNG